MRVFFHRFWGNFAACFTGWHLLAQLFAMALTYAVVASGLDWQWYLATRGVPAEALIPAVILGGLLPLVVPFALLIIGFVAGRLRMTRDAGALGQAAFFGWLISSTFKAFTGRAHPSFGVLLAKDITHDFKFGFLRGGIFWGWPSSHTTVAFAMGVALSVLYREKPVVRALALLYAAYVGLAVSASIHWLSDALAGAVIGTVIGLAVGGSFRGRTGH